VRAFYRALEELLALSLLNGQRLGLVRAGNRRMMGAMALGAIKELLLGSVEGRIAASARQLTDEVMRFLAGGILTQGLVVDAALSSSPRSEPEREERGEPKEPSGEVVH
jgi:hypothetical protein